MIIKKTSKICDFLGLQVIFSSLKFVGTFFCLKNFTFTPTFTVTPHSHLPNTCFANVFDLFIFVCCHIKNIQV